MPYNWDRIMEHLKYSFLIRDIQQIKKLNEIILKHFPDERKVIKK